MRFGGIRFFVVALPLLFAATSATGATCAVGEYQNNGVCTPIDNGYYGTNCNIPNNYTELEYIHGTGTQYIDTGVMMQYDYEIRAVIDPTSLPSSGYFFWGDKPYSNTPYYNGFTFWPVVASGSSTWDNMRITFFFRYMNTNSKNIIIQNSTGINVNGTLYPYYVDGTTEPHQGGSLWLFKTNWDSDTWNRGPLRIYSFQILDGNGNLVRDYYPAQRHSDDKIGLYDAVTKSFYTNDGDEDFIAGPSISTCTAQEKCSNAPQNAHFTGIGFNNDCPWECDVGFGLTAYNMCMPLCAKPGYKTLRAGADVSANIFAERNTRPAMVIQSDDTTTCYIDLVPGRAGNTINVEFNGNIYHTVNVAN